MQEVTTLKKKSSDKITISYKEFFIMAACYLTIPAAVMVLGWIKLLIALPAVILLILSLVFAIKHEGALSKDRVLELSKSHFIAIIVFSVISTVVIGVGELVAPMYDHAFRRAMLRDLINYDWPIYYDLSQQSNPVINAMLPDTTVAYSYYSTFWMIPAVLGKLFGFMFGNIVLVIWSAFGIFLILTGMTFFTKKFTYASFFVLICYSGLDALPYFFYMFKGTEDWMWLEGWTEHISFISNINNLLNVFNQCIPCWLIVILLMTCKSNKHIGLIAGIMFTYSPWATIGVVPLAAYALLSKEKGIKGLFSVDNIASALTILCCFAPMYMANSSATSVSGTTLSFYGSFGKLMAALLLVMVIEVVPSVLMTYKMFGKDKFLWVATGTLMVLPLYKISNFNDLTMRGAMPAQFVLCVMLAAVIGRFFIDNTDKKGRFNGKFDLRLIGCTLILITMSFIAFQQLLLVGMNTMNRDKADFTEQIGSFGDIRHEDYAETVNGNFFVYDYEDQFFYRYMARR